MGSNNGYFAIGAEKLRNSMNFGALIRSADAFGASFFFTVGEQMSKRPSTDTTDAFNHLPYHDWKTIDDMKLPHGCKLVGIEITPDAVNLPVFKHPPKAAYILGPENGSISPEMMEKCDYMIKIPTRYCLNVAVAGSIVMYDRIRCVNNPRSLSK